jgi:beta-glucosidase
LATHVQGLLANYYGVSDNLVTILEGIVGKADPATKVEYKQGVLLDRENVNPIDWFSGEASSSDVTIACLGISQLLEGEEGEAIASPYKGDRMDIKLPENQVNFLKTLRENANKLVVVLVGGSPIACEEVYEMADALLFVWYPGEQGGNAVADIIFGDALPTGRLPITFPRSIEDIPPYEDYNMAGRTYKYMEVEPLFPFGFGLSYNQYEYADLSISNKNISEGELLIAEFSITNNGNYAGEEVLQFYLSALNKDLNAPLYDLKKFEKIYLEPGETKNLQYEITPEMMETVNENGERVIAAGNYRLSIGGSCPIERSIALGAAKHLSVEFNIN